MSRNARRLALAVGLALLVLLVAADAFWLEPHELLFEDHVQLPLAGAHLRLVHLSDLHITGDAPLLHDLLRRVAAEKPEAVVISGDLVRDIPEDAAMARRTAAAAAFVSQLRRLLPNVPLLAVQGHSEFQGEVVAALHHAGLTWLSNEGTRLRGAGETGGEALLLGVNQQAGIDRLARAGLTPFQTVKPGGEWLHTARLGVPFRNFYSHYDPAPSSLADTGGPLAWSGYDALCDVRIDHAGTGAGIQVHSRYVLGEDRMIRLRRVSRDEDGLGTFNLLMQGSAFTGGAGGDGTTAKADTGGGRVADHLDTGVEPEPGRWYRMRLRTRVDLHAVHVLARVWPADQPEPGQWQAWGEDHSPDRIESGTAGIWAWGGGTVQYRGMKVIDASGQVLFADPVSVDPAVVKIQVGPEPAPAARDAGYPAPPRLAETGNAEPQHRAGVRAAAGLATPANGPAPALRSAAQGSGQSAPSRTRGSAQAALSESKGAVPIDRSAVPGISPRDLRRAASEPGSSQARALTPTGDANEIAPNPATLRPNGWRDEARGTRLEMALARSPEVSPDTPRILLSHTPDIVLEASQRGIEVVLAGHTHGGQVRLPVLGAITTRSSLGPYYDFGTFCFAAPNRRGLTYLFINSGVGTSLLPVRFLCPPSFALVVLGH